MKSLVARALYFCVIPVLVASGCALLSKGDKVAVRYFSLARVPDPLGAGSTEALKAKGVSAKLLIGRVSSDSHLDERFVFRNSRYEIKYRWELRWSQPPELSLKRLLAWVLFEERGLQQVVGGAGPTLDVQLAALDDILSPKRRARVQLIARLHDEHLVLWEETLTVDRPVVEKKGRDSPAATVKAMSEALQAAVELVADRVVRELEAKK